MRIAIITQPLLDNYGGLLQNLALQTVLRREYPGAEVMTFDQVDSLAPLYLRIGACIKRIVARNRHTDLPTKFDLFRKKYINATPKSKSYRDFEKLDRRYCPDVYIVGSDQVWRPAMTHNLEANFLSFTKCQKKVAYAASFGIDKWEFTQQQTDRCSKLLKDFTAISVRENDGVRLCHDYLGCEAQQVLDPTLLLSAQDYETLLPNTDCRNKENEYIFTYILDSNPDKQKTSKTIIGNIPEMHAAFNVSGINRAEKLSPAEWIAGIRDAQTVICDSFHGAAFSIIFNKEFYILDNPHRGSSRLKSLLSLFGIEDRLIISADDVWSLPPIDWTKINKVRENLIADSLLFLHNNI